MKEAFEKMTGMPDAWTNPALMMARNAFIQGWETALAQLSQEPVAWLEPEWGEAICPEVGYEIKMTDDHPRDLGWIPLYAHPPHTPIYAQRTWVGLTDEEIDELHGSPMSLEHSGELKWVRIIEAKLKEKNSV
jgi:hypothetical protein